jgi:Protein of unknown function (DUF3054)
VRSRTRSEVVAIAAAADAASVVLFVAAGRRSHDEGSGLGALLEVAAPFLLALGAGWVLWRAWRQPSAMGTGVRLWATTLVLGMVLRRVVFDRGTAVSFVIVTTVVLGLLLLGWRLVAGRIVRARRVMPTG